MKMRKLSDIPNHEGIEFTGIDRDGYYMPCRVIKTRHGTYTVNGFDLLIGWETIEETRARLQKLRRQQ